MPYSYTAVIEAAMLSGLFPSAVGKLAMVGVAAFSAHETLDWVNFDIQEMNLVDNRYTTKNSAHALAGVLTYSSGKVLKNVLPIAALNLFILAVGGTLAKSGVPAGRWLLKSSLVSLVSGSLGKPNVQAYGETTMLGLLWAGAASCAVP